MTKEEKQAIMAQYATPEGDTRSPEVHVAVLRKHNHDLTAHSKSHSKVTPFRHALLKLEM